MSKIDSDPPGADDPAGSPSFTFAGTLAPGRPEKPRTKAQMALDPVVPDDGLFNNPEFRDACYFHDGRTAILNMEVADAIACLKRFGIRANTVVTSPPYYGQRDYGVAGQIGFEEHPSAFIAGLVERLDACRDLLVETGSLWVNLGDTYWNGKGQARGGEAKQKARRFGVRPQDRTGDGKLCVPKQLLLVPHRFAIGMQDRGWILRNDNVWVKPNPIPDQVRDRCMTSKEYVFHFVRSRWYYFDKEAVGRPMDSGSVMPPLDCWTVPPARRSHEHRARFAEELLRIPVLATTPPGGVVVDTFAGSGTTLLYARRHGFRSIGIDLSPEFCALMAEAVTDDAGGPAVSDPPR